ncbi:hypothetical protein WM23_07645 [Burkholderia ubonensis]|nr:hypothetical protein WM23_07645 [Burkholderia ubonensis]
MALSGSNAKSPFTLQVFYGDKPQELPYFVPVSAQTVARINQIPEAVLTFHCPGFLKGGLLKEASSAAEACRPGTRIQLKVKVGASSTVLFTGLVLEQGFTCEDERAEFRLKVRHRLQGLTTPPRSQLFADKTDADIIKALLQEQKVSLKEPHGLPQALKHEQLVQVNCTDWQFISARLSAYNVWLLPQVDADAVKIVKPQLIGEPHLLNMELPVAQGVIPLTSAAWHFSNQGRSNGVAVASWDALQQKMSADVENAPVTIGKAALDPSRLDALNEKEALRLTRSVPLQTTQANALANARQLAQDASSVRASFTVLGTTEFALGDLLMVEGFGSAWSGTGLITEVGHTFGVGGVWRTTISVGQARDVFADMDASTVPRAWDLYVGKVAAYQSDASTLKGLNRLRVYVPELMKANEAMWARFAMPYASKDSGLCLYPEKDDEVVLGFFNGDPSHPVILGAMHNPEQTAPYAPSQDNDKKALVLTKDKTKLKLELDTKDASMVMTNGEGKDSVTLQDGVKIETTKEMLSDAQDLVLKAKAGIKATAMQAIAVEANQKLELKGKAGATVTGATVELKNQ